MNFKEWMMRRGLSASTAEKYAGAIAGPLTEWGVAAGVIQGALIAMESPATYADAAAKLEKLPIFIERNERGHNMYSSALARFASYLDDVFSDGIEADIEGVFSNSSIGPTEKLELVKARIGQGIFRQRLLSQWKCCAVTGYSTQSMLVASHIKPWSLSSNAERLSPFNGLLLVPNIDRAFDKGFLTFEESGAIVISPLLPDAGALGISGNARLALSPEHQPFMTYHRDNVFLRAW